MPRDPRRARDAYLHRKYGISLDEYERLLELGNGACWMCGRKPKPGGRSLHVDHNHKTGQVRGLLDWSCNAALKGLRDNPETALQAADYLRDDGQLVARALGRSA